MKRRYINPEVQCYKVDMEHLLNVAVSGKVPDPGSAESKGQGYDDGEEPDWNPRDNMWDDRR